ncbi:MAG: hypothetical protein PHF84_11890 [bacterium]|nr:hypothetical protein [bacterium]
MKIKLLLILCFLPSLIRAFETNTYYFIDYSPSSVLTNQPLLLPYEEDRKKKAVETGRLYKAEILYGNFENLDANIVMSRESGDVGYLITYNRFKINSYTTNDKKLYNSSYGYDTFQAGVNMLLLKDLSCTLNVDYHYQNNGMLFNTNYNNQFKRRIRLAPQFRYYLNEKSFFNFNFLYHNLDLEFESSRNSLQNKYYYFSTEVNYRRIWSTINSLNFYFMNIQDSLQINRDKKNNNYARFMLSDQFALSKMFIINTGLAFDVNKNYPFTISPRLDLSFLFPRINFKLGYEREYDPLACQELIRQNSFMKYPSAIPPRTGHKVFLNTFISLSRSLTYNLNLSWHEVSHYPRLKADEDGLIYPDPMEKAEYDMVRQEVSFKLLKGLGCFIQYNYIPFIRPGKITDLPVNKLKAGIDIAFSVFKTSFILNYSDLNYFLDKNNNYINIQSNILMDIFIQGNFTRSFGMILKVKNLTSRRIFSVPLYPSLENIINIGITAGF